MINRENIKPNMGDCNADEMNQMVSSWKGPDVLLDWCFDPCREWLVKLKVALSTPPMKIIYIEGKMLTGNLLPHNQNMKGDQ